MLANATLQMLAVVVIVVLAPLVAAGWFVRLDLTRDRLFSLDEASKHLVADLERPLVVRAWLSTGLEAPYNNHETTIRDKLDELAAYSNGRMQVTVMDPASDPAFADEARRYGLTPLEYTVRHADRAELRKVWMGAVLLYGERTEVLPNLTSLGSLEYDLASAIRRLKTKAADVPVLAWSIGHGEPDPAKAEGPVRDLLAALAKKARVVPVELGGPGLLAEDVDALLVVGPQSPLGDRAVWQIDQFLVRGGAAAFFLTNTRPDLRALRVARVGHGLEPLLSHLGVQLNRDIVLDRAQNGALRLPVREGDRMVSKEVSFPLIPRVSDLSPHSVLTAGLDAMLVPFASSLTLGDPLPDGVRAEVLARSATSSGSVANLKTIDPAQLGAVLSSERRGPFDLIVALTGSWRSFFETRPAPDADPDVPVEQDGLGPDAAAIVEGAPTRIVVCGSSDLVANNPTFVENVADWLVQDESLIGIRSKLAAAPLLRATTDRERLAWRVFALGTSPLLLVVYGLARQARRRRDGGTS